MTSVFTCDVVRCHHNRHHSFARRWTVWTCWWVFRENVAFLANLELKVSKSITFLTAAINTVCVIRITSYRAHKVTESYQILSFAWNYATFDAKRKAEIEGWISQNTFDINVDRSQINSCKNCHFWWFFVGSRPLSWRRLCGERRNPVMSLSPLRRFLCALVAASVANSIFRF